MFRQRTAMYAANELRKQFDADSNKREAREYLLKYRKFKKKLKQKVPPNKNWWIEERLFPDPSLARVRVYATQSTHKTLTSLRQGSMIHIHDQDYESMAVERFMDAYITHSTTSPNYQILASLDLARRQVEFEGFELVRNSLEMAMTIRQRIANSKIISTYFRVLTPEDLIPKQYRQSGITNYRDKPLQRKIEEAWQHDEFVLDPNHLTLYIGKTGLDGSYFRSNILMDKFGIQVNKISLNNVLLITNIGTTRSSVSLLLESLTKIVRKMNKHTHISNLKKKQWEKNNAIYQDSCKMPHFREFHIVFRYSARTCEGNMRKAFFLGYKEENCEYLQLEEIRSETVAGREVVSTTFITPYPPGFPVLVPGQVIDLETLAFLKKHNPEEVHGCQIQLGLRVFKDKTIQKIASDRNIPLKKSNWVPHEKNPMGKA
jgi:arginine decarboxylase